MPTKNQPSYLTWPLKIILHLTGTYGDQYRNLRRFASLVVIIGYISAFYTSLGLVINASNILMTTESLTVFTLFMLCFCQTLLVILHKDVFLRAVEHIESEIDPEFVKIVKKRFIKIIIIAVEVMVIIEILYLSSHLIVSFFFDMKLGTPESLLYPGHIPWRYNTKVSYIATLLWQSITLMQPVVMAYGIVATFCTLFVHMDSKFQLILASIENLENEGENVVLQNEHVVKRQVDDLHQVIKEYNDWKRNISEFIPFIADCSGVALCCITFCSTFAVANSLQSGVPIVLKIKNSGLVIFIFFYVFLISFLGEYFQNANNKIRDAIYSTTWYTKSTKIRKIITIMMSQTQVPMTVKAYGMITVNMSLVLHMVRIIYSISNLYHKTYKYR